MERKMFLYLMNAQAAHAEFSRGEFTRIGLTEGQPKVLFILERCNGIVQKELALLCKVKPSTLTGLLTKLEEQEYIRKEPCYVSGKKRAFKIFLTKKGEEKAEEVDKLVDELDKKALTGFSDEEKDKFFDLLKRVEINMKA